MAALECEIVMISARNRRQRDAVEWAVKSFGFAHTNSVPQRAVRFLEEAIELYQAAGGDLDMAHKLLDFVFGRPVGDIGQELGGVGLTTLLLAAAAHRNADDEELREIQRVLSKPTAEFTERNRLKNEAGFEVGAAK